MTIQIYDDPPRFGDEEVELKELWRDVCAEVGVARMSRGRGAAGGVSRAAHAEGARRPCSDARVQAHGRPCRRSGTSEYLFDAAPDADPDYHFLRLPQESVESWLRERCVATWHADSAQIVAARQEAERREAEEAAAREAARSARGGDGGGAALEALR